MFQFLPDQKLRRIWRRRRDDHQRSGSGRPNSIVGQSRNEATVLPSGCWTEFAARFDPGSAVECEASERNDSGASLEIMPYGLQEATNNALGPRNGTLSFVAATGTTFSIKASSSALARAALEGCMNCPKNGSAQAVADPFAHIDPDWEYAEHFVVEQESVLNPGSWVEVTRIWQTFCEADFDSDVDVDGKDFFDFLADYERSDCDGDCQSDFDEDGNVDENDLQFIIADFGKVNCTEF